MIKPLLIVAKVIFGLETTEKPWFRNSSIRLASLVPIGNSLLTRASKIRSPSS
jgi:hypothetical protein